ncbi:MAG: PQQ-binding-like beta-propeller repeat protein [Planctomycetes bacterium]|nr:PQQ-binding-like beta-propeller repeat protein [Planctomycetota bacterium]
METIAAADASVASELPPIEVSADDWPWWRGPERNNHAPGPLPPLSWSESENVLWKAEVPGRGHATPSIWGDRIFIATADEKQETQSLLCYDRASGNMRWSTPVHQGGFMHAHSKNSQASATPACDGERVFTSFINNGGVWVTAVDLDGKVIWQTNAGPFASQHGYGSAPAIYQSLVIVSGDNQGPGFVAALHRETGEIVWRTARENDPSYGTPILAHTGGREQLLLSGQNRVESLDPATGKELWNFADGPADVTANTMAWNDSLVFAGGGFPQSGILAIRPGDGEIVWRSREKLYVPSPLAAGDRLFVVQDNGVARCFNAATGEEIWKRRLGGDFSASPVLCEDYIFVPDEKGVMHVFKAADQYEEIARNELADGGGFASPVICGGRLYIRTSQYLYRIGENR